LVVSGQINLEKLISHRFPLGDINEALQTVIDGKGIKVIITPQR
jgi:Zn-dependent alcohol dehydrogenase